MADRSKLPMEYIRRECVRRLCELHTEERLDVVDKDVRVRIINNPAQADLSVAFAFRGKVVYFEIPPADLGLSINDFAERWIWRACNAILPRLPNL
jgi:hypothetical protein